MTRSGNIDYIIKLHFKLTKSKRAVLQKVIFLAIRMEYTNITLFYLFYGAGDNFK